MYIYLFRKVIMNEKLVDFCVRCFDRSDEERFSLEDFREKLGESLSSDKIYFYLKMALYSHEKRIKVGIESGNETYEPKLEKTKDSNRINTHWTDEVDTAKTSFEDLPSDLKCKKIKAAIFAVDLVYEKVVNWEKITLEEVEKMSGAIHENWMENNLEKKDKKPELFVPYDELPEHEKEKDRVRIRTAIYVIESEK